MADVFVNNIPVPRIARNKRIYTGSGNTQFATTGGGGNIPIDWAIVNQDLVTINRSLTVDGDLTVNNLAGNEGDLVFVDANGTMGTLRPVIGEVPAGDIDDINVTFVLANIPYRAIDLYKNGQLLKLGVDYTIIDDTITMTEAPSAFGGYSDYLQVNYSYVTYTGTGTGSATITGWTAMTRGAAAQTTGYDIKACRVGRSITITGEFVLTPNTPQGSVIAYIDVATIAPGLSLTNQVKSFYTEVSADNDNRGVKYYVDIFDPVINTVMQLKSFYEFDGEDTPTWLTLTFNVL